MPRFTLKDLDGSGNELSLTIGNDGDIHVTVWSPYKGWLKDNNVRIGLYGNTGGQDLSDEKFKYLKKALSNLAIEFQYLNEEISEDRLIELRKIINEI